MWSVTVQGKKFPSFAKACKFFGLEEATIKRRINTGWSLKDAFSVPVNSPTKVEIGKLSFKSINQACVYYGTDLRLAFSRIERGWALEKAVTEPPQKSANVLIKGITFKSINAACKHFNVNTSLFYYRQNRGWSTEEALNIVIRKSNDKCKGKLYIIKNNQNKKVYIGITLSTIETRFKQHLQKAKSSNTKFSKAIRKIGKNNFNIRVLKQTSNKQTLSKLEVKYIKKYDSINKGYNTSVGGYGLGDKFGKSVIHKGIKFESVSALARYIGVSASTISARIDKKVPLDVNKQGLNGNKIKYRNTVYDTIADLARHLNISISKIHYRIANNYCLNGKTSDTDKKGFYKAILLKKTG